MAALVKSGAVVGALIFLVVVWGEPTLLTQEWAYVPLTVGASGLVPISLVAAPRTC
jgi:hypothetical protein